MSEEQGVQMVQKFWMHPKLATVDFNIVNEDDDIYEPEEISQFNCVTSVCQRVLYSLKHKTLPKSAKLS